MSVAGSTYRYGCRLWMSTYGGDDAGVEKDEEEGEGQGSYDKPDFEAFGVLRDEFWLLVVGC